ncbi:uncharacterized protein J3D65DRAFT_418794 [Phyllosticta citribraziliensis]|uniref:ML-like domain-containing protein n=1 Tax=Phyllosticta citribraziliensis TaxID=989973 RepID=A0ABR1LRM6_9PEZI
MESRSLLSPLLLILSLLLLVPRSFAQTADVTTINGVRYVSATDDDGNSIYVRDNRQPSLYTGNYGDCLGDSSINVTRFDAAYYKDNMTVLFHLAGDTSIVDEGLMMYIAVYAYGESQFELVFNPCNANINSLCPMRNNVSIEANGIIPIAPGDVANIPTIAYSIPDFEGQAILRIFANSTQQMIGCYSASITNGNTFSQQAAVGSILGIFTAVACVASVAAAIYGSDIPVIRKHYAHSMSVFVVFSVLQHIYFTGALSMNWPSVLVAFWSNYAWAGGMIYTQEMQNSINKFIGSNKGNTTAVGAASTGTNDASVGGGYDITKIYKRGVRRLWRKDVHFMHSPKLEHALHKRALANSTDGYSWYGQPVKPGLPLPGNYSGFAGTLGTEGIPASNAFTTGFLWFLILVVIVAACIVLLKWTLELLSMAKVVRKDRLSSFRTHWIGYTILAVLRVLVIGFFMLMFLTLFQFTYKGSAGVTAVAALVFIIFFCGMFFAAAYACRYRIRVGNYVSEPDRVNMERRRVLGIVPWYRFTRASAHKDETGTVYAGSLPFWRVSAVDPENQKSIHDDEEYTRKFGWLASRFRRTRWWFFSCWLGYEFVRACFLAGASGHPMTQVFGLLVIEFIAFVATIILRPFESQRLNALMVYLLGFSKVSTVALSAAFDIRFNLARITTTVIGIVIIVIQGILTIFLLLAIFTGAITTYFSLKRHTPTDEFRPRGWRGHREKYFTHLDKAEKDLPPEPPAPVIPQEPQEPKIGFNVSSVRRVAKIEDEDEEFMAEIGDPKESATSIPPYSDGQAQEGEQAADAPTQTGRPRAVSRASIRSNMSYTSLPRTARVHRASWSSRDFLEWADPERNRIGGSSATLLSEEGNKQTGGRSRTNSLSRNRSRAGTPTPNFNDSRLAIDTRIQEMAEDTELPQSPQSMHTAETHHSAKAVQSQQANSTLDDQIRPADSSKRSST